MPIVICSCGKRVKMPESGAGIGKHSCGEWIYLDAGGRVWYTEAIRKIWLSTGVDFDEVYCGVSGFDLEDA